MNRSIYIKTCVNPHTFKAYLDCHDWNWKHPVPGYVHSIYSFAIAAADAVGSALSAVQLAAARESIVPVIAAAITAQRGQGVGTCQKNVLNVDSPYIAVICSIYLQWQHQRK